MRITRSCRAGRAFVAMLVLVGSLVACGDRARDPASRSARGVDRPAGVPGPIGAGYEGIAYPVPSGADPGHPNSVPVTLADSQGHDIGPGFEPAGTPVRVRAVRGHPDQVAIISVSASASASASGVTAIGARDAFWVMPTFIALKDVTVKIAGVDVPIGTSGVRYHRGSVATFQAPFTRAFDGMISTNREFLACRRDTWGMGGQTFAVDLVEDGLHRQDRSLLDLGVKAMDWGVAVPINSKGIHELHRDCDGKTVADFGYTHHTTQWLESLGRTVYLLAASPWAGEYHSTIDRYRRRIDTIATLLSTPSVKSYWVTHVKDSFGNDFTHRLYMRAAAMGMASTLAAKRSDTVRWAADARGMAERATGNQWPSGVNPERGGFDVLYQMYGTWLAELYDGTLPASSPTKHRLDRAIDRAIRWMTTRIDPQTGQIKIVGTTRVCVEELWTGTGPAPFVDPAETIRGFLLWGHLHSEPNLIDDAMLVDRGFKQFGNKCPLGYHARPEAPPARASASAPSGGGSVSKRRVVAITAIGLVVIAVVAFGMGRLRRKRAPRVEPGQDAESNTG